MSELLPLVSSPVEFRWRRPCPRGLSRISGCWGFRIPFKSFWVERRPVLKPGCSWMVHQLSPVPSAEWEHVGIGIFLHQGRANRPTVGYGGCSMICISCIGYVSTTTCIRLLAVASIMSWLQSNSNSMAIWRWKNMYIYYFPCSTPTLAIFSLLSTIFYWEVGSFWFLHVFLGLATSYPDMFQAARQGGFSMNDADAQKLGVF